MRSFRTCVCVAVCLLSVGPAQAEIGTIDDVPAATLLVPYFEVDLLNAGGINTLFSINNATATAILAHVTLWTDMSIPTFDFDVYLTGYDVQTISLRDIFVNRTVPRTADFGSDPADTISNKGVLGQDINIPGTTGPCVSPYDIGPNIPPSIVANLQLAHTGREARIGSAVACFGADHGDLVARGYVTVDTVAACNLSFPGDSGYVALLTDQNVLFGDYFYVNGAQNFAQGETLVHIESCIRGGSIPGGGVDSAQPGVPGGNYSVLCPFALGEYTFYGRYAGVAGQDQREPLATVFASRFVTGGPFSGGTDLIVWRDSKTFPVGVNGAFDCSAEGPAWFPLSQSDVVAFDEEENPEDRCFTGDNFSPPTEGTEACFPLEAGRYSVETGNAVAPGVNPTAPFGWLFLNLNHSVADDPFPEIAQSWVTTVMSAEGRFSVGFDAIQLDNVVTEEPGGKLLLP